MTSTRDDLDHLIVVERELWREGPPHEVFRRLRSECPVHWTSHLPEYPAEAGFWSVTRAEDIQTVSRDWRPTPQRPGASPPPLTCSRSS